MDTNLPGDPERARGRALHAALGAAAGLSTWAVCIWLPETLGFGRLPMTVATFVIGTFAVFFALDGPLRMRAALPAATALVLPATSALLWASFRFDSADSFFDTMYPLSAFIAAVTLATPFVAARLHHPGGWRDYGRVFDTAWTIFTRYTAAWAFCALVWLLLWLSDALLRIVDIDIIGDLMEEEIFAFTISGTVLGLALAVTREIRETLSHALILWLLRLLLPFALLVTVVFLLAIPVQGLSGLFGTLSPARTLMLTAIAALTLVTSAVDRDAGAAVRGRWMRLMARALALTVPVLAGLAVAGVAMRVSAYGWTPDRVAAMLVAGLLLLYGLAWGAGAAWPGDWMARLRRANLWMALVTAAAALAWLTPVLDAQRISSRSQEVRFTARGGDLSQLPAWEMAHDWGHAGRAALARLEAREELPRHAELVEYIARARRADSSWNLTAPDEQRETAEAAAALAARIPVYPGGGPLPAELLTGLQRRLIEEWDAACDRRLADGRPGCAAVVARFTSAEDMPQAMILTRLPGNDSAVAVSLLVPGGEDRWPRSVQDLTRKGFASVSVDDLARIHDGAFEVAPATLQSLRVGDRELVPQN